MMTKTRLTGGSVLVTFELPAAVAAAAVSVCGDFNDWSPTSHQLTRTDNGSFRATLELPAGRRWRFRYLLDGQRWENDWAADDYLPKWTRWGRLGGGPHRHLGATADPGPSR
jgi:1,4-alpha-glucan branching enzyme